MGAPQWPVLQQRYVWSRAGYELRMPEPHDTLSHGLQTKMRLCSPHSELRLHLLDHNQDCLGWICRNVRRVLFFPHGVEASFTKPRDLSGGHSLDRCCWKVFTIQKLAVFSASKHN